MVAGIVCASAQEVRWCTTYWGIDRQYRVRQVVSQENRHLFASATKRELVMLARSFSQTDLLYKVQLVK